MRLPRWDARRQRVRRVARGIAAGVLVLVPLLPTVVVAQEEPVQEEPVVDDEPAIPPGQEDLLAEMLGKGATLPGKCKLADSHVDHVIVEANYICGSDVVVFLLTHPSVAEEPATQTDSFALQLHRGSPPEALQDALVSLIRSREADFKWTWPASENEGDEETADDLRDDGEDDLRPSDSPW